MRQAQFGAAKAPGSHGTRHVLREAALWIAAHWWAKQWRNAQLRQSKCAFLC